MTEPTIQPHGTVSAWLRLARRRRRVGLTIFAIVAGLAGALVFLTRPIWRAEASLRLGAPANLGGLPLGGSKESPIGLFSLFQQITGDPFANELELLSSRTVVEGVVADNALNVAVHAPRGWYRDSLFTALDAGRATRKATFEIEWRGDGRVHVRRTAPTEADAGSFAPGADARFGDVHAVFQPWRDGMPRSIEMSTYPFPDAVRRMRTRVRAERERREANLVALRFDDDDPGLALRVIASAVQRYTALRSALDRRESGETVDSLDVLANRTFGELTAAENDLEHFERENRLVAPDAQSEAFVKRQSAVAADLATARSELHGVEDVIQRIDTVSDPGAAWPGLVAHPTFLDNETLGNMLSSLIALQQQRIELASRRTENSRPLQALDRQIAYLDGSLRALVHQYRGAVAQQVAQLEAQWNELDSVLAAAPAAEIELGRRERHLRQLSEIYLFTDQRRRQEALRNAVSFASVQLVDPAAIRFKPVWPRKKLGLGIGLILAMGSSLLGMVVVERADRSVRTASDLAALVGAPVAATLAAAAADRVELSAAERRALLRRASVDGGVRTLVLAPIGDAQPAVEAIAAALVAPPPRPDPGKAERGDGASTRDPARLPVRVPVETAPALARYAAAAEVATAAEQGGVVLLVARQGKTRREEAVRAGALLRQAGVCVDGVVLWCDDARGLEEAWA